MEFPHCLDAAGRLRECDGVAHRDPTFVQNPDVQDALTESLRVEHFEFSAIRGTNGADVANLAALLTVEVGAIKQESDVLPGADAALTDNGIVFDPAEDLRTERRQAVLGAVIGLGELALDGRDCELFPPSSSHLFEFFKEMVEGCPINFQFLLGRHLLSNFDVETLFGMEIERSLSSDGIASRRSSVGGGLLEQLDSSFQSAQKGLFFTVDHAADFGRIAP